MKKTLFSILACCLSLGMAQAAMKETAYEITLTFDDLASAELTPGLAEGEGSMAERLIGTLNPGKLEKGTLQQNGEWNMEDLAQKPKGDNDTYMKSFMAPDVNIGGESGLEWVYTYEFVAGADFDIHSLSLAMATFNNNGKTQNTDRTSGLEFSLTKTSVIDKRKDTRTGTIGSQKYDGTGVPSTTDVAFGYDFDTGLITSGSGAIVTFDEFDKLSIHVGDTVTLEVTARNDPNNISGHFVGLGAARFNVTIPEPATATLSLLALAGFAARRRRK